MGSQEQWHSLATLTLVLIALMCTVDANTRSPENYNGIALGCDFNFCWCFCTQVVTRFLRLLSLWDSVICIREFAWISMGILIISELLIGTDVKWGTIVCLKNVNPVFIVRVKPSVHKDIPITRNYKEIEGDSREQRCRQEQGDGWTRS